MRRLGIVLPTSLLAILLTAGPTLACGGLIGPNGAVNLLRTTTFAGYHDGVEHYVTAFQFAGGGGAFGSITPLPDVPSSVVKGGDWTLQRLVQETSPAVRLLSLADAAGSPAASAEELMKVKIDALDITVLRGGAAAIGTWATDHGFRLPPDSPEVLDFYAQRSPIFLAAALDISRDAGQRNERPELAAATEELEGRHVVLDAIVVGGKRRRPPEVHGPVRANEPRTGVGRRRPGDDRRCGE